MTAMPSFVYGDKTYEYSVQLVPNRKKTISVQVLSDAAVEVKAPLHTDKQKIIETMKKRARWVVRHVEQIERNNAQVLPREYISGETHFYLGRRYQLKVVQSDINQVKLDRGMFMVESTNTSPERIKSLLESWYKEHARAIFKKTFKHHCFQYRLVGYCSSNDDTTNEKTMGKLLNIRSYQP